EQEASQFPAAVCIQRILNIQLWRNQKNAIAQFGRDKQTGDPSASWFRWLLSIAPLRNYAAQREDGAEHLRVDRQLDKTLICKKLNLVSRQHVKASRQQS